MNFLNLYRFQTDYIEFFFFRIKGKSAFLSNYEVMQLLQQIKDNAPKKHIMEGSLATVTYEVKLKHHLHCAFSHMQSREYAANYIM